MLIIVAQFIDATILKRKNRMKYKLTWKHILSLTNCQISFGQQVRTWEIGLIEVGGKWMLETLSW